MRRVLAILMLTPLLHAAANFLNEMATFESASVSEKSA